MNVNIVETSELHFTDNIKWNVHYNKIEIWRVHKSEIRTLGAYEIWWINIYVCMWACEGKESQKHASLFDGKSRIGNIP